MLQHQVSRPRNRFTPLVEFTLRKRHAIVMLLASSWRMTLLTRSMQRDGAMSLMSLKRLLAKVSVLDLGGG